MTLFSLLEDEVKVGPGVINTPQELTFIEATVSFLFRQGCQISSHVEQ